MFKKARQLSKLATYKKSYANLQSTTFQPLAKAKYTMQDYNLSKQEKLHFQKVK